MGLGFKETGTISVTAGSATVTGTGVAWSDINEYDVLAAGGSVAFIDSVTDTGSYNELTVKGAWRGPTLTNQPYLIVKFPKDWTRTQQELRDLLNRLKTYGVPYCLGAGEDPDNSVGEDGQFAFRPSDWTLWLKVDGVWVEQPAPNAGPVGPAGGGLTLDMLVDYSSTTDADPGQGKIRGNVANNLAGSSVLYVDKANVYNNSIVGFLSDLRLASSAIKGYLRISAKSNRLRFAYHRVTSVDDATGYVKINVQNLAGAQNFADGDAVDLFITIKGDKGDTTTPAFGGTSATSLAIGTGAKTFTTQSGLAWQVGARVRLANTADPTKWMEGIVTAYSGTSMTLAVDAANSTGTLASWNLNPAGEKGATGGGALAVRGGRLSLVSGDPVPEADVVGATTVYLVPATSNTSEVWDGAAWQTHLFSELPLTLVSAHTAANNFDVFDFVNAGVLAIGTGPAWSAGAVAGGPRARGQGAGSTELELYQGRLVNKNAITLRNGSTTYSVAARKATLRGTIRTTANGETEDSAAKRFVSNAVNAELRPLVKVDTTTAWTYSTPAWRQARGSAANQFEYVQCVAGRRLKADVNGIAYNSTDTPKNVSVGVGIDSATVDASQRRTGGVLKALIDQTHAFYAGFPGVGYHEIKWLEYAAGAGDTQTWCGIFSAPNAVYFQAGIQGETLL
ncbi:MAG: hypothetical protein J0H17_08160 [Rhizobiales bacterium]|nr:hypothetical protein [Hyphomicrobiales bacterium]